MLKDGEYKVEKVTELSFFDLFGDKANTSGTSNKSYHLELQVANDGVKAQLHSIWGPTGGTQTREWRYYTSVFDAEKDFASIVKSKTKKGYKEVKLAQRTIGSDAAKQITASVTLKNVDDLVKSNLTTEVQYLINKLFENTNNFVSTILKCPLGQLTNEQIDKGRYCLTEAQDILTHTKLSSSDKKKLESLTNDFYSLIPHNLGQGARGKLEHLLLDDKIKIAQKEQDLDDLLDAKAVGAQLIDSDIDDKYKSLQSKLTWLPTDHMESIWIQDMMEGTKAKNHHHLGKIKLLNTWKLNRHNEEDSFIKNCEKIASEYGKQIIPNQLTKYIPSWLEFNKNKKDLYTKSNTMPLWHGTRSSSLIGIIKNGLLIRPSGAVISGSMFGDACYFGFCSKSINYTSIQSSYWAKGTDDKAFMFLLDVALGNQKVAMSPYQFTKNNIKPCHSVWAQGGKSGVINDEFMVYDPSGPNQQFTIKYIIEFTCLKN